MSSDLKTRTLLVVDDDAAVLRVAKIVLTRAGFSVLTANDGMEALGLCRVLASPVDLLLTDVKMPKLDGVQLAAWLGIMYPGTPVIFMTGYPEGMGMYPKLMSLQNISGRTILRKPFSPADLARAVKESLPD